MLAKKHLRRCFDAGGVVAVEDRIQIHLQDLAFVVSGLERRRHHRLPQLDQDRLLGRLQDGDLGQLLGDGAGALLRAAGQRVDDARFDHPPPIDAVVLVEVLVFDGNRGLLEQGVDIEERDRVDAGPLGVALLDQGAVAVLDDHGAGRQVELAGIGQGRVGVGKCSQHKDQDQSTNDGRNLPPVLSAV